MNYWTASELSRWSKGKTPLPVLTLKFTPILFCNFESFVTFRDVSLGSDDLTRTGVSDLTGTVQNICFIFAYRCMCCCVVDL